MRGKGTIDVEKFDGLCPVCGEKMVSSADIIGGTNWCCGSCGCMFSFREGGVLVSISSGIDPDTGEQVVFGCWGVGACRWSINEKPKGKGEVND